ncbi:MAG: primosomal protein N' [Calditrichaeota bacterium]|nr:MAG: primosomal protein N' [Calditrichota bacterium]
MTRYIKVAVSGPLKKTFTYTTDKPTSHFELGQRIVVPFGNTRLIGFYAGESSFQKGINYKPIKKILDEHSYFTDELFKLCSWISDYYFANLADTLFSALPAVLKKNKSSNLYWNEYSSDIPEFAKEYYKPLFKLSPQLISKLNNRDAKLISRLLKDQIVIEKWTDDPLSKRQAVVGYKVSDFENFDDFYEGKQFQPQKFTEQKTRAELISEGWTDYQLNKAVQNEILEVVKADFSGIPLDFIKAKKDIDKLTLTKNQQTIYEKFRNTLSQSFSTSLLHGVTGSGKTLVYCHICREVLNKGKTVLVLTPEIALTSTTLAYFRGFFKDEVTVIHSAMTERERLDSWNGIRQNKYKIVVGPRSALFAPLQDVGLIIVDEEHDSSYKQDDPAPRFHGRDSAIMRAKINNIPVLLGSASPSVESYQNAQTGRYELLELTDRPGNAVLPTVRIVDMRTDRLRGDLPYISYTLKKDVDERLKNNQQVILFLNRRGHSPQMKCISCGHVAKCPNCQVYLTYHKKRNNLVCHQCGYFVEPFDTCPNCSHDSFFFSGVGTQKVEENIPRLFEGAKALRLDSDAADGRKKAYEILTEFAERKSNLLLGTQMVTKGLDMPGVTLVGVLSADSSLDLPDFRASEKTFSKLLQVAGRSGRAEQRGEVLIQTFNPTNPVILDAAEQNYQNFFNRVIKEREELFYPPFSRIVNFTLSSEKESQVEKEALIFREKLHKQVTDSGLSVQLLGPAPCPIYFLRKRYRRHLFVKTNQVIKFVRMLTDWENLEPKFKLPGAVRISVDVDPDDMM